MSMPQIPEVELSSAYAQLAGVNRLLCELSDAEFTEYCNQVDWFLYCVEEYESLADWYSGYRDKVIFWFLGPDTFLMPDPMANTEALRQETLEGYFEYACSLWWERRKRRPQRKVDNHNRRARDYGVDGHLTVDDIDSRYDTQNGLCWYCGLKLGEDRQIDHVFPLCKNGNNYPQNVVLACADCNRKKGSRMPCDFRKTLKRLF